MTQRAGFFLALCLMLTCVAMPLHAATTACAYTFTAGSGISYLTYCVTVHGNIPQIETPNQFPNTMIGADGEGYGICDQNIQPGGINYTDYGVSDTGNWNNAVLVRQSSTFVKVARTTADGHWTLTQTISKVPQPAGINVVMALTNNQSTSDVAYLIRYADAVPNNGLFGGFYNFTNESAFEFANNVTPSPGLLLQNLGTPPFGFWSPYVQTVSTGPNACAFAFNASTGGQFIGPPGSIEIAYVGAVASHQTKTVTLRYQPF